MPVQKSRNWSTEEDQLLRQFMNSDQISQKQFKYTWNEIAAELASRLTNSTHHHSAPKETVIFQKTGKQCRQRWINHLSDGLNKYSSWTDHQNKILFQGHEELGNKWAAISQLLPGRTDNCVKNHYYSVMRRGLRKVNQYIEQVKRKESPTKIFKNEVLNKILQVSDKKGKYDDKFRFEGGAKDLAGQIKQLLIKLSGQLQIDRQESDGFGGTKAIHDKSNDHFLQERAFELIACFCKNCKKKKNKKVATRTNSSEHSYSLEENEKTNQKGQINSISSLPELNNSYSKNCKPQHPPIQILESQDCSQDANCKKGNSKACQNRSSQLLMIQLEMQQKKTIEGDLVISQINDNKDNKCGFRNNFLQPLDIAQEFEKQNKGFGFEDFDILDEAEFKFEPKLSHQRKNDDEVLFERLQREYLDEEENGFKAMSLKY